MKHKTVTLFSLPFATMTHTEASREIERALGEPKPTLVFTPNATILRQATRNPSLLRMLKQADLLLPDGMSVVMLSRILKRPIKERLPGIEMGEEALAIAAKTGARVYLLGGKAGVAEKAAERLKNRFSGLNICGVCHGYFTKEEEAATVERIQRAKPQVLLVCMGFPRQEAFLLRVRDRIPTLRLGMGLGGSLDVWSGTKKRAPKIMGAVGLEWLWRAMREPRRFSVLWDTAVLLRYAIKASNRQKN